MIDFNHSNLFISLRSPFARRVRLAFHEHGVEFKETVVDVFKPQPELAKKNPLSRVPTLELATGEVLVDSNVILQAYYENNGASGLIVRDEKEKLGGFKWSGIAAGVCDKLVEYYLEILRPEDKRDPEVLDECKRAFDGFFTSLESELSKDQKFILGKQMTQADLDLGTALAYTSLRFSDEWTRVFPKAYSYFTDLDKRPSFQKTRPPK